jgi:flagellar brake protein
MTFQDDAIESFTISSKSEIVFYLRQLINDQEPLTVMFDEGRESMLTMALHLDEAAGQLILDWGGSETMNNKLLRSSAASFVAAPLGVRNLFQTGSLKATNYQGRPAFAAPLPGKYIRLQRREFFRLHLPMAQRVPCRVTWPAMTGNPVSGKAGVLSVVDLCVGGIGAETKGAFALDIGTRLPRAAIDLGKFGVIHADLDIRFVGQQARGSETITRLGCQFVDLGRGDDLAVQRFITQIQRDQRARLG